MEEIVMEMRALQVKHTEELKEMQEKLARNTEETRSMIEESSKTWANMQQQINEIKHTKAHREHEDQLQLKQIDQKRRISPSIPVGESLYMCNVFHETNSNIIQLMPSTITTPIFHGYPSELPRQFLKVIKKFTETVYKWEEDQLIHGMFHFLQDLALDWYYQLRARHLPKTWDEFKEVFIAQFDSPLRRAQRERQWKDCIQTNEETIRQFIVRLSPLWEEQFPQETEADLVHHLLCKIRFDILSIIGCPTNAPLQEVLLQAESVEQLLRLRAQQNNLLDQSVNKPMTNHKTTNTTFYQRTRRNQTNEQNLPCQNCGRFNHQTRHCWHRKR